MKKCYYFPTWKEQYAVMISLDEGLIKNCELSQQKTLFEQSTPSDPILVKLCELTGAKMYRSYIVFNVLQQRMNGDVLRGDGVYRMIDFADQQAIDYEDTVVSIGLQCEIGSYNLPYEIYEYCFNAFEEYSKFLRGEENKWEEVKKIVL